MVTHSERSMLLAHESDSFSNRSALEPPPGVCERSDTECEDVIQVVAWNETQQVQKQLSRPELQLVERSDEMRL